LADQFFVLIAALLRAVFTEVNVRAVDPNAGSARGLVERVRRFDFRSRHGSVSPWDMVLSTVSRRAAGANSGRSVVKTALFLPFATPVRLAATRDSGKRLRKIGTAGFEPTTSCTPSKRASQAAPRPVRTAMPPILIDTPVMAGVRGICKGGMTIT